MHVIEHLISLLAPHECLGCQQEGSLLCSACAASLRPLTARCYRCRRLQPGGRTCTSCRSSSRLDAVRAFTPYRALAKAVVWKLKYGSGQAAAAEIAGLLAPALSGIDRRVMVTPVPTATSRARTRGYDQARLIAKALARQQKLSYLPCLARHGQAHQVGAGRRERLHQLEQAFRVKRPAAIRGAHILLVDDVLTTGATLEAAAAALRRAGAKRVEAIVFAQA